MYILKKEINLANFVFCFYVRPLFSFLFLFVLCFYYNYIPFSLMNFWVFSFQDYDPYRSWSGSQYGSRFSLDHPGTRTLETSRPLGPEHPGTRILSPASLPYSSLQNTKSTYSNSRPSKINFLCTIVQRVFRKVWDFIFLIMVSCIFTLASFFVKSFHLPFKSNIQFIR